MPTKRVTKTMKPRKSLEVNPDSDVLRRIFKGIMPRREAKMLHKPTRQRIASDRGRQEKP
jgi:hypothetical protein